jgi:hypothetical protein
MQPIVITTSALTDDDDGIAQLQTLGGAGSFTLNGALVSGGVATAAMPQKVIFTSTGNISGTNFTVTGTDADGKTVTSTRAGPNNNTVATAVYFKTVTSVTTDGAVGTNTKIGWRPADGFCTASVPVNWRQTPFNLTVAAELTGTATFGAQWTADDPQSTSYAQSLNVSGFWTDITGLDKDSNAASGTATLSNHVRAVRGIATAVTTTATVKYTFLQGQNG